MSSPDENVKVNYDWDGLGRNTENCNCCILQIGFDCELCIVYDKREVIVVAVEVVISTFEHLYDLKTELDVAFDTTLKTGEQHCHFIRYELNFVFLVRIEKVNCREACESHCMLTTGRTTIKV